jgi:hypothetical protein
MMVLSLSNVSMSWFASRSLGNTQRRVKSDVLVADRREAAHGGFIWMAPMYLIGEACLPTWKPSITRPRSFDCAAAA